ncbi:MAG TPA: hypothetical protein VGM77_09530 [Gemmatimonadales bacterium]
MTMFRKIVLLSLCALGACRGASPSAQTVDQQHLQEMVQSLLPAVSKAVGLTFKSTPKSAIRSRAQIHDYLIAKMARELPDARVQGVTDVYQLLDMLPDSIDLRQLFVDLYTEQIAGFYDPDSTTFYAVEGGDPALLRVTLAHELVHALQHQYMPIDSILKDASDGDRQAAAQAILEGQATLASLVAVVPGIDVMSDQFWETIRQSLKAQQTGTTVYARAPMVIRESLTFPYTAGADFMRWFDKNHPGQVPFGPLLPKSTEQILHPDRYARGDQPLSVRFTGDSTGVLFEDTFGEFDIDLLRAALTHATEPVTDPALGWGGDRLRVYTTPAGPALVWYTVWDTQPDADRFRNTIATALAAHPHAGDRTAVEALTLGGHLAVRVTVAPPVWASWSHLPGVEVR